MGDGGGGLEYFLFISTLRRGLQCRRRRNEDVRHHSEVLSLTLGRRKLNKDTRKGGGSRGSSGARPHLREAGSDISGAFRTLVQSSNCLLSSALTS